MVGMVSRKLEARARRDGHSEAASRREVIATALAMHTLGLSPGRSGNVSCRWAGGMLITPSGMPYESIAPADVVQMGAGGACAPGQRKPSSEWHFHLAIYAARPDISAIIHCHSRDATALACARRPIPAFHYMVAAAGGSDIPLVPYATFGTEELARLAAAGLGQRNACLLANHGQIAVGGTLSRALDLAAEVENLAAQYLRVLAIGGGPILDADEMARVVQKFASYGQGAQPAWPRPARGAARRRSG
jgi:L-fuculose-phosphate aldolase